MGCIIMSTKIWRMCACAAAFGLAWLMGAVAAAAPPLPTDSSTSPKFRLTHGSGLSVCDAYVRYLNERSSPFALYQCRIDDDGRASEYGFSVPDKGRWVTPLQYDEFDRSLLTDVKEFLWQRDANPVFYMTTTSWGQWRNTPEQLQEAHSSFVSQFDSRMDGGFGGYYISRIDLDNDGKDETVLRINPCKNSAQSMLFFVLDPGGHKVDQQETERLLAHPARSKAHWGDFRPLFPGEADSGGTGDAPVTDAVHGVRYSIFRFDQKNYIDLWWYPHPEYSYREQFARGRLRVFLNEGGASREVCTVQVHP